MKDKRDNNAKTQAAYKARMRAQGFKQTTIWVHEESFRRGAETAKSGGLLTDFTDTDDAASFAAGFCSISVEHEKMIRAHRKAVSNKEN